MQASEDNFKSGGSSNKNKKKSSIGEQNDFRKSEEANKLAKQE